MSDPKTAEQLAREVYEQAKSPCSHEVIPLIKQAILRAIEPLEKRVNELEASVMPVMCSTACCEACGFPLSECGAPNPDGTPSIDCLVCRLRETIRDREGRELKCAAELDTATAELTRLKAELAEAMKDKERLDWIESEHPNLCFICEFHDVSNPNNITGLHASVDHRIEETNERTMRQALDSAMKKEGK